MVYDPEDGSRLALEVAYSLARARVLMAKGGVEGLDAPALRAEVERALGAMDDVRRIKLHLTNAAGGIESARGVLEGMAERVRGHLAAIDALVLAADDGAGAAVNAPGEAVVGLAAGRCGRAVTSTCIAAATRQASLPPYWCLSAPRPPARGSRRASPRRRRSASSARRPRPGRP